MSTIVTNATQPILPNSQPRGGAQRRQLQNSLNTLARITQDNDFATNQNYSTIALDQLEYETSKLAQLLAEFQHTGKNDHSKDQQVALFPPDVAAIIQKKREACNQFGALTAKQQETSEEQKKFDSSLQKLQEKKSLLDKGHRALAQGYAEIISKNKFVSMEIPGPNGPLYLSSTYSVVNDIKKVVYNFFVPQTHLATLSLLSKGLGVCIVGEHMVGTRNPLVEFIFGPSENELPLCHRTASTISYVALLLLGEASKMVLNIAGGAFCSLFDAPLICRDPAVLPNMNDYVPDFGSFLSGFPFPGQDDHPGATLV